MFSLIASLCSFLGLSSVEIKSGDVYLIVQRIPCDYHSPICIVTSSIQSELTEINRWVIIPTTYMSVIPSYGNGPMHVPLRDSSVLFFNYFSTK